MLNNEVKTWEPIIPPKRENITKRENIAFTSTFPENITHYPDYCVYHSPHKKMFS